MYLLGIYQCLATIYLILAFLFAQTKNSLNDQFFIVLKAGKIVRYKTIEEMRDNIASRRNQMWFIKYRNTPRIMKESISGRIWSWSFLRLIAVRPLYIRDDVDYDEETSDKKLQLLPASIATNINSYKDQTSSSIVLRRNV